MKKPSTSLKLLAQGVMQLAERVLDRHDIDGARLAALENRIALIDGGENAAAAVVSAYGRVRDRRAAAGKRSLSVLLKPVDGELALVPRERKAAGK